MKRITAIAIAAAAFIGCSYVGEASAETPCEHMFNETALVESGIYAELASSTPKEAGEYKDATIQACASAIRVARKGVGPGAIAKLVSGSITSFNELDALMSVTRVQLVMSGWSYGAEGK